ncbi:flagellar hook-length control protein FliK [Gilvimarinus polysaccharolyticus]|uniref:flagellar hook-length control protein FliK n=1 Tax=Gilvimarinus polysaccharolyticus TaxID=863921 RepID=UPI000A01115C|nr:flagellar hook-length control protein FliK [Gilvimarinus polysaccharolyticus]
MATNEPTLLSMLLRPQGAVQSTQTRVDASRDAQLFSESLNTAYKDIRSNRPDTSELADSRVDRNQQQMATNDDRQARQLESRANAQERAAQLADTRAARHESQANLSPRQQDTLESLEPEQREVIEALPTATQAQVLDELADRADSGLGDESLSAIMERLDPQLREQLMALLQSLTDQAQAGASVESIMAQVEQAVESGQVPPELAAWLSDQLNVGAKTAGPSAESLAGRLDGLQTSLKQALTAVNSATSSATVSADGSKDSAATLGLMEPAQPQLMATKDTPLSLDGQREQGALLETAKLHNLLAGRSESVERPTASSITSLTESLGLANRTLASPSAPRVASQMLPGFNQNGWGDAVGQKVLWMAKQNITSADLRLDPPDLGKIHVRVTIQNDQAHVSFASAQPVVREALDQHSARLREMLAEQGMTQVDVDVSDQRSFAESDSRAGDEGGSGHSSGGQAGTTDMSDDERSLAGSVGQLGVVSLIDQYA